MTNGDLRDRHVGGEKLGQGLHARPSSTIEGVAHRPRVRILAVPQSAVAHRVLASARLLLLHLRDTGAERQSNSVRVRYLFLSLFLFSSLFLSFFFCSEAE